MPFVPKERSGSWVALQDLAGVRKSPFAGKAIRVFRGFLEDDDSNLYKGESAPRFIVHGTVADSEDGEEVLLTSRKGGSRDYFLEDAAQYLDTAPEGSYIDIGAEPIEGSQYIKLVMLDSVDA